VHYDRDSSLGGLLQRWHNRGGVDGVNRDNIGLSSDAILDHRYLLLRVEGRVEIGDLRPKQGCLVVHSLHDGRDGWMIRHIVDDTKAERLGFGRSRRRQRSD
jgi:hypothetical protein